MIMNFARRNPRDNSQILYMIKYVKSKYALKKELDEHKIMFKSDPSIFNFISVYEDDGTFYADFKFYKNYKTNKIFCKKYNYHYEILFNAITKKEK